MHELLLHQNHVEEKAIISGNTLGVGNNTIRALLVPKGGEGTAMSVGRNICDTVAVVFREKECGCLITLISHYYPWFSGKHVWDLIGKIHQLQDADLDLEPIAATGLSRALVEDDEFIWKSPNAFMQTNYPILDENGNYIVVVESELSNRENDYVHYRKPMQSLIAGSIGITPMWTYVPNNGKVVATEEGMLLIPDLVVSTNGSVQVSISNTNFIAEIAIS